MPARDCLASQHSAKNVAVLAFSSSLTGKTRSSRLTAKRSGTWSPQDSRRFRRDLARQSGLRAWDEKRAESHPFRHRELLKAHSHNSGLLVHKDIERSESNLIRFHEFALPAKEEGSLGQVADSGVGRAFQGRR